MEIQLLSTSYQVKYIDEADLQSVYILCKSNPLFYQYCPPFVTPERIKQDLTALPPGKKPEDKYYLGFYQKETLVAIIDLIFGYPNAETAFIGFFMIDQQVQGKGNGTAIITEVCQCLKTIGFSLVRLGYAKGNPQSEAFWAKNSFEKTGVEVPAEDYVIVVMQRYL